MFYDAESELYQKFIIRLFSRITFNWQYLKNCKCYNTEINFFFFFDLHLKSNQLVYIVKRGFEL